MSQARVRVRVFFLVSGTKLRLFHSGLCERPRVESGGAATPLAERRYSGAPMEGETLPYILENNRLR